MIINILVFSLEILNYYNNIMGIKKEILEMYDGYDMVELLILNYLIFKLLKKNIRIETEGEMLGIVKLIFRTSISLLKHGKYKINKPLDERFIKAYKKITNDFISNTNRLA